MIYNNSKTTKKKKKIIFLLNFPFINELLMTFCCYFFNFFYNNKFSKSILMNVTFNTYLKKKKKPYSSNTHLISTGLYYFCKKTNHGCFL